MGSAAAGRPLWVVDGRPAGVFAWPGRDGIEPNGEGSFRGLSSTAAEASDFRFLRFRPPPLEHDGNNAPALPHIRLDRALQFLIGDRLQ